MGQCCTSDRGLIKLPSLANDVIGNVRVQLYCIASVFNASSAHYHCWLELVNYSSFVRTDGLYWNYAGSH